MGRSLAEYAAENPRPEPVQDRRAMDETARTYIERKQELETVEELKGVIMEQLEQGNAPELILLTAVRAIGIFTHDMAWMEAAQSIIDGVYADLAQQSLLVDNATIAAQRLDKLKEEYNRKTRKKLEQSIRGYSRLEKALNAALRALSELDDTEALALEE